MNALTRRLSEANVSVEVGIPALEGDVARLKFLPDDPPGHGIVLARLYRRNGNWYVYVYTAHKATGSIWAANRWVTPAEFLKGEMPQDHQLVTERSFDA